MKTWQVPKIWEDGECWIVGGGTSMPRMLGVPENVIQSVQAGVYGIEAYSPYLLPILHDRHVIGANMACKLGGAIVSVLYFGDMSFFHRFKKLLIQFSGIKVSTARLSSMRDQYYHRDIRQLKKDDRNFGISTDPAILRWNKSSGGACIGLACQMGVKRIVLLGFDMNADSGKTHWHGSYRRIIKQPSFNRFLGPMPAIAADAKKLGVEILNVNPNSAIKVFKKVELKDVL